MANELYQKTAYAVQVGTKWFGGFNARKGMTESNTPVKLHDGLCGASLMWDYKKATTYVERLKAKGYEAQVVLIRAES